MMIMNMMHTGGAAECVYIMTVALLFSLICSSSIVILIGSASSEHLENCDEQSCFEVGGHWHCLKESLLDDGCVCLGVINCTINITDCSCSTTRNPCYSGTCLDMEGGGYECNCSDGWSGSYCDIDEDACVLNKNYCEHGACVDGPGAEYYCNCNEAYRGLKCDELFCPMNYCKNNGTCILPINSTNASGIACECTTGYYGARCEIEVPKCAQSDCIDNSGDCVLDENDQCICFGVLNCTTEITHCNMSHSYIACSSGRCYNATDYTIGCDCDVGFGGDHCQIDYKYCEHVDCGNGFCIDGIGTKYHCVCDELYKGVNCEQIYCPEDYCSHEGECKIGNNDISCECVDGYEGDWCQMDPDVCIASACSEHGNCIELPGDDSECDCFVGYIGEMCEKMDPDICGSYPCLNGGMCVNVTNTSEYCNCTTGFGGENCTVDILDMCSLTNNPCLNNASCIDGPGMNYSCNCLEGYSGDNCEIDNDYCQFLSQSLCSGCSEDKGNSVQCANCPHICGCSLCSCRPSYCGIENASVENITCIHLLKPSQEHVTISCLCHVVAMPSYSSSSLSFSTPSAMIPIPSTNSTETLDVTIIVAVTSIGAGAIIVLVIITSIFLFVFYKVHEQT